ncbi:MAG: hypothetical protein DRG55_00915, partial [Deltaproteobacteria bacterium]
MITSEWPFAVLLMRLQTLLSASFIKGGLACAGTQSMRCAIQRRISGLSWRYSVTETWTVGRLFATGMACLPLLYFNVVEDHGYVPLKL